MESILQASKAYVGKVAADEKLEAAKKLRQLALAVNPGSLSSEAALGANGSNPTDAVQALLLATRVGFVGAGESAMDASRAAALRLAVFQHALGLLSGGGGGGQELTEGEAASLVGTLDNELAGMVSPVDISEVVDAAVDVFLSDCTHSCAVLEMLPKALALLGGMGGQVDMQGEGDSSMSCSVSDFVQGVLHKVCQHEWPPQRTAKVLLALRDLPMTQETFEDAVRRAIARSRAADVHDLPSIVHQLLMLSAKGNRDMVLLDVVTLFEQREAMLAGARGSGGNGGDDAPQRGVARRQLLEVEGSVLLHMDLAVKHDAELGQAWLRYLRSDAPRCSPFMLAVSFMIAAIQRFEQPVIDALKALVMSSLRDAASLAASPWLPAQQPSAAVGAAGGNGATPAENFAGPPYVALREALLQCVRNSAHGQAALVQPLAALAVALMEAGAGAAEKGAFYEPDGTLVEEVAPAGALACDLGTHMLLELFRGQKEFRRDVVEICHSRLIGAKEDVAAPFVRLIAMLVRQDAAMVVEYMNDFKVALENLAFLPPNAALSLLLAVWPLCRTRRDVQDYLVMLLRKAMFSRELHARLLAARGFLCMCVEEMTHGLEAAGGSNSAWNRPSGSSQVTLSQMSALSGGPGGATLLHELMSFLRRCLSQQAEVRRALYEGMPAVLAADPTAQECVVEPLLPHFCHFYETNETLTPPLKLEACARLQGDTVRVVEPLQHQLAGIRRVLRVAGPPAGAGAEATDAGNFNLMGTDLSDLDDPDGGAMSEALRSCFATLRRRLVACTLEDFGFDQSTNFDAGQPGGELQLAYTDILLGCMEVVMEDLVEEIADGAPNAAALAEDLHTLFGQHHRLVELATHSKGGAKGKKDKLEGLTQAVGARKAKGRPPAGGAAGKAAGGAGVVVAVDKRTPVLSVECLCKLLGAVYEDSLGGGSPDARAATSKLARDTDFQTFAISSALRLLQSCAASDTAAAIATGTAGSEEDSESMRELLAVPDWQQMAVPLFRAVQTVVLSCAGQRVVAPAGTKKEKDGTEVLTQAALKALEQLLSMGRSAASVAALLREVPPPDPEVAAEAGGLPQGEEFTEPQRIITQQLPHFKQMLTTLVEHCCSKELESLCASLQLLAGLLPAPVAAAVGGWTVEACQTMPPQGQQPGAAKALVTLALRCSGRTGGDVALMRTLADEIKTVLGSDEVDGDGEVESDKFPIIGNSTLRPVAGVLVAHLESVLGNLEWVLSKVKLPAAAAKGREPSLRQAQTRMKWAEAAYQRLQHVVELCGALLETPISGQATCEALLKATTRLYKVLGAAAKGQLAPKGASQPTIISRAFQDLVASVNRSLTSSVYAFISDVHGLNHVDAENAAGNVADEEDEAKAAKASRKRERAEKVAASKAKRESKLIPNLIFQLEEFEKHLIRITRSTDGKVNLMLTAKRSTNRDFKLNVEPQEGAGEGRSLKRAKRAQQQQQEEEQEEAPGEGEEGEEEGGGLDGEEGEGEGIEYE